MVRTLVPIYYDHLIINEIRMTTVSCPGSEGRIRRRRGWQRAGGRGREWSYFK